MLSCLSGLLACLSVSSTASAWSVTLCWVCWLVTSSCHNGDQELLEMVEIAAFGNKSDITVMCDNNSSDFEIKYIKKRKEAKKIINSIFCRYSVVYT